MGLHISIDTPKILSLDLSPAKNIIQPLQGNIGAYEQQLYFEINFPRDSSDPREISEIPEVRLWFLRLDAYYPWLPFLLDWKQEFARYTAMLVPHQFSPTEGILYNPEALEIFVMHKVFILKDWLDTQGIPCKSRLQSMAQILGYELEDSFFELL